MLDTFKKLTISQFEAALCTLNACVERCPDANWNGRVGSYVFCQVAFHTLFYADYYLGPDDDSFRRQPFHRDNAEFFGNYEEFQDREPTSLYDRASIGRYVEHCRRKAAEVIAAESEATLTGPSGFERRNFSRAELHVYNTRHIQHHAAQLSLRLRLDANVQIPWVGYGWRQLPAP
jgi:glutamine synthetase